MDWNANSWCVAIQKKLLFGVGSDSSVNYFSSEVTSILVTTKNTTAIIAIISVSKKRAVINQLIRRKTNQTTWRNANQPA